MSTIQGTSSEVLQEWLALYRTQLTWGLSKQARKATEIKIRAIEMTLEERRDADEQRAS